MAFSAVTGRGSTSETGSDTSIVLNPSANLTVGKLVFVVAVTDNYVTSDGASAQHSLADDKGNGWRKISEYTETSGVAADGVTISIFGVRITTQILTTDAITLTLANAVAQKILACFEAT